MCGVMLKHHGYNVIILEQEVSERRKGYDAGIRIGPAHEEFLKRHDRVKREMIVTCNPGYAINFNGRPKVQRGQAMLMTSWGLVVSVLRANFDGLVSAAVPVVPESRRTDGKAEMRFGQRATSVEAADDRVKVSFLDAKSGNTETIIADITIVADGSNSHIRTMLHPETKREYTGYMCWRGTVREADIDEEWNKIYSERTTFHLLDRTYLLKYVAPSYRLNLQLTSKLHHSY